MNIVSMTARAAQPGLRNPDHAGTPSPFYGWGERTGMKDYKSQYMHPKWQKRRLEMLEAAGFMCQCCESTEDTLHVHHKRYIKGRDIWDYDDDQLEVLCADCHKYEHFQKDELANLLEKLDSSQMADVICIVAGMLEYSGGIEESQLKNWRSLSVVAVDAGFIAASLLYDRGYKDAELIASVFKNNPCDCELVISVVCPDR